MCVAVKGNSKESIVIANWSSCNENRAWCTIALLIAIRIDALRYCTEVDDINQGEVKMLFNHVAIEAVAHEDAPNIVSSAYLEKQIAETIARLSIKDGKLENAAGIRERRFYDVDEMPSEIATRAARKVIEKAQIDPQEIGCLINSSVTKDYIEPSVACLVHGNLGLSANCINFDITNACLGFLNGMSTIGTMIEMGHIRYGLVVSGENPHAGIEATIKRLQSPEVTLPFFHENFASLTLGCGGVAMLLSRLEDSHTGHALKGYVNLAATQHNRLCIAQADWMKTDSRTLLSAGAELVMRTWLLATRTLEGWAAHEVDLIIPHQVSKKQIETAAQAMGLDLQKVYLILDRYGNMASAALPAALSMAVDEGRLQSGHHAALIGIGSGINCSMMSVRW